MNLVFDFLLAIIAECNNSMLSCSLLSVLQLLKFVFRIIGMDGRLEEKKEKNLQQLKRLSQVTVEAILVF